MGKVISEKLAIFFVSILIASNTGFYILGKAMASADGELFSVPLLIAIILSTATGVFSVFRKK